LPEKVRVAGAKISACQSNGMAGSIVTTVKIESVVSADANRSNRELRFKSNDLMILGSDL